MHWISSIKYNDDPIEQTSNLWLTYMHMSSVKKGHTCASSEKCLISLRIYEQFNSYLLLVYMEMKNRWIDFYRSAGKDSKVKGQGGGHVSRSPFARSFQGPGSPSIDENGSKKISFRVRDLFNPCIYPLIYRYTYLYTYLSCISHCLCTWWISPSRGQHPF